MPYFAFNHFLPSKRARKLYRWAQKHCTFVENSLTPNTLPTTCHLFKPENYDLFSQALVTVNWGLILCLICIKAEEIGDK